MHGGDIYNNKVNMDFSVNVNPCKLPESIEEALRRGIEECCNYPELESGQLRAALGRLYGIAKDNIVVGNGASEILMGIVRALKPQRALLLAPGFTGYEHVLKAVDCQIYYQGLREDNGFRPDGALFLALEKARPDILFFCNPANPTGVLMEKEYLIRLAQICQQRNITLVLDECFMELTGKEEYFSLIRELDNYSRLIILRAFTKTFRIPGVRLGYALCNNKDMAHAITSQLPEWNVSLIAQYAGLAAIDEQDYIEDCIQVISEEKARLRKGLQELGCIVFESRANYLFFYCTDYELKEKLLARGILIRDCSDYEGLEKGYYRIAVRLKEDNLRLLNEMRQL